MTLGLHFDQDPSERWITTRTEKEGIDYHGANNVLPNLNSRLFLLEFKKLPIAELR